MPGLLTKEKDTSVSQAEERREGNPFGTGTKTIMSVGVVCVVGGGEFGRLYLELMINVLRTSQRKPSIP